MRSKPPGAVLAEAAELVADGAVELNLIAQDTAAYGADLAGGRGGRSANLPGLLRRLDRLGGLRWVRLMYAHPASVTPAVIDALADCRSAVKYLDLPLQHVNDRLLARMRRGYDRRGVEALLARLRRAMPGIALRTTFIVGLPGEGRREFDELLGFVRDQRFDAVGVLPYWPEEGTPAARMAGQVPARTRRRRLERLMVAQQEIAFAANAARVGRRLAVLVDGADARGRCVGRHAGQAPDVDGLCRLARPAPAGRIVQAVVTGYDAYDLVARPL
jgi:ribosomal protein S12 methylthiotransferase